MGIFWITLSAASFGFAVGFLTCALFTASDRGNKRGEISPDLDDHDDHPLGEEFDLPHWLKRQAE